MFKIEEVPIVGSPQPPDREPEIQKFDGNASILRHRTSEDNQKTSPQVDNEVYGAMYRDIREIPKFDGYASILQHRTSEDNQKTSPQVDNEVYQEGMLRLQEMEEMNRSTLERLDKEEKSQPVSTLYLV